MDNAELLNQLADIHTPESVSFWPLAPGWWILAVLLVIVLFVLGRWLARTTQARRIRSYALAELDKCYEEYKQKNQLGNHEEAELDFMNQANAVLRRVALEHYPQERVASLSGQQWVDFLSASGDASLLSPDLARALSQGRFSRRWDINVDELYHMAQRWISSLYEKNQTASNHA